MANSGEDEFEEIFKLVVAKLFSEIHPTSANSFSVRSSSVETAQSINDILAQATNRWKGLLFNQPISLLTDEHLTICVKALQSHSLLDTHLEVLDGAFEYLVSQTAKGAKGQYFTPRHVIDCCVQILNPSPTDVIIDPACGSAGFLIHVLNYIRQNYPEISLDQYCQKSLWGCDFSRRAIQVAKTLMLISGNEYANLFQLNSLLKPNKNLSIFPDDGNDGAASCLTIEDLTRSKFRNFKGFDIVLTNPPFAGEIQEKNILNSYSLYKPKRRLERDILFLERCVHLLRIGGRLAIVLPHNKLGSATWAYVREWLIRQLRIVAVLGLGRNTFLPHTHQKACILFGVKREQPLRTSPNEDILFLISDKDGKDSKGQIIARPNTQLEDPAWLRVDHDLGELVSKFHYFIQSSGINWGNS